MLLQSLFCVQDVSFSFVVFYSEACPRGLGAVIVHLTTTSYAGVSATDASEALSKAIASLCSSAHVQELWHMSFALPLDPTPIDSTQKSGSNDLSAVQGAVVLRRLPYSCDPHPLVDQAQQAFERIFENVPYFVQSDEEREEAARARGEVDEEAAALDDAIREGERREALREESLRALLSRIEQLEISDSISIQRIEKLETKVKTLS